MRWSYKSSKKYEVRDNYVLVKLSRNLLRSYEREHRLVAAFVIHLSIRLEYVKNDARIFNM